MTCGGVAVGDRGSGGVAPDGSDDPFAIPPHLDRSRDRFEPQNEIEIAERKEIQNEADFDDDTPPSKTAWDI